MFGYIKSKYPRLFVLMSLVGIVLALLAALVTLGFVLDWNWDIVSILVLGITATFIAIQSWATKELAENETRPLVDVNVLYTKDGKHRLQFRNIRGIPAYVWTKMRVQINGTYTEWSVEPRLEGKEEWPPVVGLGCLTNDLPGLSNLVSTHKGKEIVIRIEIFLAPIFLRQRRKPFYDKRYAWDDKEKQWIGEWGIADETFKDFSEKLGVR